MLIFGMGYTASRLSARLQTDGWLVTGTRRAPSEGAICFDDEAAVLEALDKATHVLSSVPPARDGTEPVLARYGDAIANSDLQWSGYLSSTGVYGDVGGAWVDEGSPTADAGGKGRRIERARADAQWLELGARVFRLPGIYGPGRSALDRVKSGSARRIDLPGQVFSRCHVDDIASGVVAALALDAPAGAYNLGDDLPASGNAVTEEACRLLGIDPPKLETLEEANLSEMARGFYSENRRVANGKAKRVLGWTPKYPTYVEGLAALL